MGEEWTILERVSGIIRMKQWDQSCGWISGENIAPARERTSTGIFLEILETVKRTIWPRQSDREDHGKG